MKARSVTLMSEPSRAWEGVGKGFQKGVTLFKSVIKVSLIRLLNAACFFFSVVAGRGKNINWPLRSST